MEILNKHKGNITFILFIMILMGIAGTWAFFTDNSSKTVEFSLADAVDFDYSLAGSINNKTEVTIHSLNEEVYILLTETNHEDNDLFSAITLTSNWTGDTDLSRVTFKDTATGEIISTNEDNGHLVLKLPSGKIQGNSDVTHKIQVILDENNADGAISIVNDTLNFTAESKISAVKDSWAETVGPVELKLHTALKQPIKLEVADSSAHRDRYLVGDDFDSTDLVLTVTYNTGDTAQITYNVTENTYYIDKNDGNGKSALTDDDFELSNILNMTPVYTETYDYTQGGTGTDIIWGDFTFSYDSEDEEYKIKYDDGTRETLTVDEFYDWYVASSYVTLVPNATPETSAKQVYPHAAYTENNTTVECDIIINVGNAIMQAWADSATTDFHQYKNNVVDVEFLEEYALPAGFDTTAGYGPWDISHNKDNSVIAYAVENSDGTLDVKICANVGRSHDVMANANSSYAFSNFSILEYFDGTNLDTSNAETMECMFGITKDLSSLEENSASAVSTYLIDDWNVSNVKHMKGMFLQNNNIIHLDLSKWNVGNVTDMSSMFSSCWSLESLNVSSWNVSNVTTMYNMFYGCSSLEAINVSNWNVANVTDMSYMFAYCRSLDAIDVAKWNVSKVESMSSMFTSCPFESIDISKWNCSLVDSTFAMFENCANLTELTIPASMSELDRYFANKCPLLTEITFLHTANDALTIASLNPFDVYGSYNSDNLLKTYVHTSNKTIKDLVYAYTWTDDYRTLQFDVDVNTVSGITINESTSNLTAWAYYPTELDFTFTLANGYEFMNWKVEYTDSEGTAQTVELAQDELSTFIMPWADITITPVLSAPPVMQSWTSSATTDFHAYKSTVTSVTFLDTYSLPADITYGPWDVSAEKNGSVMAYMVGTNVYICSNVGTTANVIANTNCNYVFQGFSAMTVVNNAENLDTSNVTTMLSMFYNCSKLSDISSLSAWNTGKVTSMGQMFRNCKQLSDIGALSNWNTGNVTDMGKMFLSCSTLSNISPLSGWNTGNVTDMNMMFSSCSSLTNVNALANWNTGNVTAMNGMFSSCSKLTNVTGLANWSTGNVQNMASMFSSCSTLSNISGLSKWNTGNVTNMSMLFAFCSSLSDISALSNWSAGNVSDMRFMFNSCSKITNVNALANWSTGKLIYTNSMFSGCRTLSDISGLSNWSTGSVKEMTSMFNNCSSLTNVNALSKWSTGNVTRMGGMFTGCSKLTNVNGLANWNTGSVIEMNDMFGSCTALSNISGLSKWNTGNVKLMYGMFYNCSSLTNVTALANWSTGNVTDMHYMFDSCTALLSLDLSGWDTGNVTDMSRMFQLSSKLTTVYVGDGWNTNNVSASTTMFKECTAIVGGNGTTYNSSILDKTYARIDTTATPGYFTAKTKTVNLELDLNGGEVVE